MIPSEVPEPLRIAAVVPDFAREHEAAWPPSEALEVIRALGWTRVAILGAQGCKMLAGTLVPTDDQWTLESAFGDTDSRFVRKSHAGAAAFVASLAGRDVDYVALEFSPGDEAA